MRQKSAEAVALATFEEAPRNASRRKAAAEAGAPPPPSPPPPDEPPQPSSPPLPNEPSPRSVETPIQMSQFSRADFTRIIQMEANYEKGNAVRAELEQTRLRMAEQKEMFRQRGRMLREQRLHSAEKIASKREMCKQDAAQMASDIQHQREAMRARREEMRLRWQMHGRNLGDQQARLQRKLRSDTEQLQAERKASASLLKTELKALNDQVDDQIYRENCARVARVKEEENHYPLLAKQIYANGRWDRADRCREESMQARERRRQNEEAYLAKAHEIKSDFRTIRDETARKRAAELKEQAERLRREEKEQEEAVAATRKATLDHKRDIHENVELDKLVPEVEVEQVRHYARTFPDSPTADVEGGESAVEAMGASFARFFGFRKRGAPQKASSVVSL